ncbi:hypothetical protein ASA1KI_15340 [Opitutales bacterium ASA1]|uniref:hypothetical protein n=1 Tax=Congregicoccus parvus TaxID=3081749 RepID=UPI002B2FB3C3|nr:hypothetical protein ASA1KI_15340 [Opitutales bacterium ASA1]
MNNVPPAPSVYAFPVRALERWAKNHLELHEERAGILRARFHFEGSTCGNIPFSLHYDVVLDRTDGVPRLSALSVAPTPGDEGHLQMCLSREDEDALYSKLHDERPLLGRPLDDVLAWKPATEPAGCLCSTAFRNHKWRAVLETLHYALARATPAV